jgi:hypothetical protein
MEEALSLIDYAFNQREEELLYSRWLTMAQYSCSFEEFKEKLKPIPVKTDEEILENVFDIIKQFSEGRA